MSLISSVFKSANSKKMQINHINSSEELVAQTHRYFPAGECKQNLTQIARTMTSMGKLERDNACYEEIVKYWRSQLTFDHPELNPNTRESIIHWLIGELEATFDQIQPELVQKSMEYRYRILRRYLGLPQGQAYQKLIARLSSSVLIRNKTIAWIALSRDHNSTMMEILKEVVSDLIHHDRYIHQQINFVADCTKESKLQNTLFLASLEEYCFRRVHNHPLFAYRVINYFKKSQRGGLKNVPASVSLKLISEDILAQNSDRSISLFDPQAIAGYQQQQAIIEQQMLQNVVKQELSRYLNQKLGIVAVRWLHLFLQGQTQKAIANRLDLPIQQVYRLREKITYHVSVFAVKHQPELVSNWL